ncbi:MAG TPA: PfkB family carbohydrate kinase [Solirubrobacteraceae bacterium]|nr:PfkB family carbohydrate kinase [Solirubrobacteraceae bacterium]
MSAAGAGRPAGARPLTAARIVVVGDLMVDVVAALPGPLAHGSDTPARIAQHQGGSGANVAAWLVEAGARVTFAGRAGTDPLGDAAVAALDGVTLAVERDRERPTGTCIVLVHPGGERTMIPDAGANDALELTALPDGEHVHLTGYGLLRTGSRPAMLRALELARERGMTVSVDPSSAAPLAAEPAFLDWVAGAALLLPNADEARVLTGEADPERAARALARRIRSCSASGRTTPGSADVVVTLGAAGALWSDGERVLHAPAVSAEVVDTTGAGDAFAAGLLAARAGGAEPAEQLAAGCALAARAVGVRGARARYD